MEPEIHGGPETRIKRVDIGLARHKNSQQVNVNIHILKIFRPLNGTELLYDYNTSCLL